MKRLHDAIPNILHATTEPDLQELVQELLNDFYDRWGHNVYSSSSVHCVARDCQQGIPVLALLAYWAALLDPRTKCLTVHLLLEDERQLIWGDKKKAIIELVEDKAAETVPTCADKGEVAPVQPSKKHKGAASFLAPTPEEGPINDACDGGTISLEAEVMLELSYYEKKGCDLYDGNGNFLCLLSCWKANCT